VASRSRRSSEPVSTPSTICRAAMLITGRELTSQAAEKDVGRVVEPYGPDLVARPRNGTERGSAPAATGWTTQSLRARGVKESHTSTRRFERVVEHYGSQVRVRRARATSKSSSAALARVRFNTPST
jgi:hypothetical protein